MAIAAVDLVAPGLERDRGRFVIAGTLSLLGAVLLAVGASLPWLSFSATHGPVRASANAYRLHTAVSWISLGTSMLVAAGLLALGGLLMLWRPLRPNLVMAFLPAFIAGLLIANYWTSFFGSAGSLSWTAGGGVYVCLGGVACALAATIALVPTERPAARRAIASA